MTNKSYPAKLLLFGEYTVLHGGSALAIPYSDYSGQWAFLPQGQTASHSLKPFLRYLQSISLAHLDLAAFAKDVAQGLAFVSTIPVGYGAGSSGSLCAAIWGRYGASVEDITELKSIFIQMESFFHGESSGLDPLVSFLNRPVLLSPKGLEVLEAGELPQMITVYDSKMARSTAPLVQWYHQEIAANPHFKDQVVHRLLPLNTQAISAFLNQDEQALKKAFQAISLWQLEYFRPLIPDAIFSVWQAKLKQQQYLKICGAGGGGFFFMMNPKNNNSAKKNT